MRAANVVYEGADNLRAMEAAENYNEFLLQRILQAAGRPSRVLDFGAGLGLHAERVRRALSVDVICVEPDAESRTALTQASLEAYPSLEDIAPSTLDFIYSLNVLEHIPDDGATLRSLCERLAPGGRLYIYVPAFPVLFSAMDAAVGHQRRYRRPDLERALQVAGLTVESSGYVDPLGFLAALAYRFIPSTSGRVSERSVDLYDRWVFPFSKRLHPLARPWFGKNLEIVAYR